MTHSEERRVWIIAQRGEYEDSASMQWLQVYGIFDTEQQANEALSQIAEVKEGAFVDRWGDPYHVAAVPTGVIVALEDYVPDPYEANQ